MRAGALAGLIMAGLVATAGTPALAAPTAADLKFQALYKSEWTWRQKELAHADEGEDRRMADHLARIDAASQAKRMAYWQDVRARLDAIPRAQLSADEAVNYDVYRAQIDVLISQQKFREYEKPFNSDSSFWSSFNFTARRTYHDARDYRAFIGQMNDSVDQATLVRAIIGLGRGLGLTTVAEGVG